MSDIGFSYVPVGTAAAAESSRFVTLAPVVQAEQVSAAALYDVYRMFLRARSGIPASTYKPDGCPVEFDGDLVRISLDFFAWPSARDLQFELASSVEKIAEISVPEIVEEEREQEIIFGLTDHYDLDFLALQASLAWETGCYLSDGSMVSRPHLALDGSRIVLPRELFGVARLQALAWGHRYTLMITVDKGDNRITGLAPVVTASWKNSQGETVTEQLEIPIPPCVEFALSLCDGDLGNSYCSHAKREINAYFSTCTGKVIALIPGPDPEAYCSDIAP